jgi:predicted site-specific integrase-resolvase
MRQPPRGFGEVLTPAEVARVFGVDVKTVARWAEGGRFPEGCVFTTPGGHRRYKASVIRRLTETGNEAAG